MESGQVTKSHDLCWFILRGLHILLLKHVDRYSEMLGDHRHWMSKRASLKREFVIEVFYIVWNIRFKKLVNKSVITACRPIDPSLPCIKRTDFFLGLAASILYQYFDIVFILFSVYLCHKRSPTLWFFLLCSHFTMNAFHTHRVSLKMRYK